MLQPEDRPRFPVIPAVLAMALVGSNWLLHMLSFTPGQISGNGFPPEQFLMMCVSMGLTVTLLAATFRYAGLMGQGLAGRSLWVAGSVLLAAGAVLLGWAWIRFHEYEAILHGFRGGPDHSSLLNQFTVRFWAADAPFWAGLLSLAVGGGLLRNRVPAMFLMVALGLAFVLPASLVPSGYRVNSRGELVMLKPYFPVFLVQPGAGRPDLYIVQHPLLALSARDPVSGCTVEWRQSEYRFYDPCNGADYDDAGLPMHGAPRRALERYPVRIAGERFYIDLAGSH
jgi:hypothetical protein